VFTRTQETPHQYFSTFVRIQKDRNHKVVTEGPYKYVSHPGYAGAIVAAITLPISLGSLWALIPAAIGVFGFGFRTAYEDRILLEELSGYDEYSQRVRVRLIPGVW
jgi:protein-S-isoprenylcysteine O-methyltransferase Ste14